ncbi:MAG: hypothetical protein ACK40G_09255 [Cytophagaceae bacterium]
MFLISCNDLVTDRESVVSSGDGENIDHGYHELANPANRKSFPISDYNTDNPNIGNIKRPARSTVITKLDTVALFGIWTMDPEGPHADFQFSKESFYVVDYDGDGDMPYELINRKLKIYYNDFIQEGEIISVTKDTLKVKWKEYEFVNSYVRWLSE